MDPPLPQLSAPAPSAASTSGPAVSSVASAAAAATAAAPPSAPSTGAGLTSLGLSLGPILKPRWSLALSVVIVHLAFSVTALAVVVIFSNVLFEIDAENAFVSQFRPISSVRWDVFINCCLLVMFGIQHFLAFPVISVREPRKEEEPASASPSQTPSAQHVDFETWILLEAKRSRYVVVLTLLMWFLVWQWRPLHSVIWDVRDRRILAEPIRAAFYGAWFMMFYSRIQQVTRTAHKTPLPRTSNVFYRTLLYALAFLVRATNPTAVFAVDRAPFLMRHPVMGAFCIIFWSTPYMTLQHLLLAFAMSAHILVRIQIEEIILNTKAARRLLQEAGPVPPAPAPVAHASHAAAGAVSAGTAAAPALDGSMAAAVAGAGSAGAAGSVHGVPPVSPSRPRARISSGAELAGVSAPGPNPRVPTPGARPFATSATGPASARPAVRVATPPSGTGPALAAPRGSPSSASAGEKIPPGPPPAAAAAAAPPPHPRSVPSTDEGSGQGVGAMLADPGGDLHRTPSSASSVSAGGTPLPARAAAGPAPVHPPYPLPLSSMPGQPPPPPPPPDSDDVQVPWSPPPGAAVVVPGPLVAQIAAALAAPGDVLAAAAATLGEDELAARGLTETVQRAAVRMRRRRAASAASAGAAAAAGEDELDPVD